MLWLHFQESFYQTTISEIITDFLIPPHYYADITGMINDPFENLLSDVVKEIAEEMKNLQPQDLTFISDEVYLEHDNETKTI